MGGYPTWKLGSASIGRPKFVSGSQSGHAPSATAATNRSIAGTQYARMSRS